MENSIATIGDITVDNFYEIDKQEASVLCNIRNQETELCFNYGEKVPVKSIRKSFGGSALNTAIGFERMGIETYISAFAGEDSEGRDTIEFLKSNHINTNFLQTSGNHNQATIIVYNSERTILSYHNQRDYKKLDIPRVGFIYFASAGKGSDIICQKIIARTNSGSILFFNPGSWELKNFDPFRPIVKYCKAFIVNRDEADLIIGSIPTKQQLHQILKLGAEIAIITDGPNGAYLSDGGTSFHISSVARNIFDPTGAGDAFSSGFVGGMINGRSIEESAGWGMINASEVISTESANDGLLDKKQISDRYEKEKQNLTTVKI